MVRQLAACEEIGNALTQAFFLCPRHVPELTELYIELQSVSHRKEAMA
jgi:hypothetical protein